MARFPYFESIVTVLTGSGVGTAQLTVPEGESREITSLRFLSTGAFGITGIRDSRGRVYSNAASGNILPAEMFGDVADGFNGLMIFPLELSLPGNIIFSVDFIEESTSTNTVNLLLAGIREDGS